MTAKNSQFRDVNSSATVMTARSTENSVIMEGNSSREIERNSFMTAKTSNRISSTSSDFQMTQSPTTNNASANGNVGVNRMFTAMGTAYFDASDASSRGDSNSVRSTPMKDHSADPLGKTSVSSLPPLLSVKEHDSMANMSALSQGSSGGENTSFGTPGSVGSAFAQKYKSF